jgi:rhodanese-related sulfurtransferase
VTRISVAELASRLARDDGRWPRRTWALLDVREAGEAERAHIPGATFLPRRRLEFRIAGLVPAPATPIVVYDGGDGRAELAAATLARLGYGRVETLAGGIEAWRAAGHVVESGSNVPSKRFGEEVVENDRVPSIRPEALKQAVDAGERVCVCDVRTVEEYEGGTIPGGRSAPGFELALAAHDLARDYDRIVVNCAGRTRSIIATGTLRLLGFERVAALENGTMGWQLAGFELERGAARSAVASAGSAAAARNAAQRLSAEAGVRLLSPADLQAALQRRDERGLYVIDVRPSTRFAEGHVPGAVMLPGGQAVQRIDDFVAVPGAPIVFVDDGDARALLAAYWLRRMGFPDVSVLDGGMPGWKTFGGAVAQGLGRAEPPAVAEARRVVAFLDAATLAQRLAARPAPAVIDVGTSREFAEGHLPGAAWLPRGWLEARIGAHARPDQPVIVATARPAQAVLAAATLRGLGYDAAVLEGGTSAWARAGYQLETGLSGATADDLILPPYDKGHEEMRRYLEWEQRLTRGHP